MLCVGVGVKKNQESNSTWIGGHWSRDLMSTKIWEVGEVFN
jgi:hypothetical protein